MLALFLLLVSFTQDPASSTPFTWVIEGMGDRKSPIVVTISVTPFGLGKRIDVEAVNLYPLPTRDDPNPQAIVPLKTERPPERNDGVIVRGLRAWFTPPGRRFHLLVSLSDGSTHRIDIHRTVPVSAPVIKGRPIQLIAPRGTWTIRRQPHKQPYCDLFTALPPLETPLI